MSTKFKKSYYSFRLTMIIFIFKSMISHLIYAMFNAVGLKKCVILELSKRTHINYLRPSSRHKYPKKQRKTSSKNHSIVNNEGADYIYAPMFGAGRVIVASMLGLCILCISTNHNLTHIRFFIIPAFKKF